jgi:hypothetical protein
VIYFRKTDEYLGKYSPCSTVNFLENFLMNSAFAHTSAYPHAHPHSEALVSIDGILTVAFILGLALLAGIIFKKRQQQRLGK